jgi:hypothetical protein
LFCRVHSRVNRHHECLHGLSSYARAVAEATRNIQVYTCHYKRSCFYGSAQALNDISGNVEQGIWLQHSKFFAAEAAKHIVWP